MITNDTYMAIMLFIVFFALDFVHVWYLEAIRKRQPIKSGVYSIICHGIYFIGIYELIADWKSIIFMLAGAGLGAYIAVKFNQ